MMLPMSMGWPKMDSNSNTRSFDTVGTCVDGIRRVLRKLHHILNCGVRLFLGFVNASWQKCSRLSPIHRYVPTLFVAMSHQHFHWTLWDGVFVNQHLYTMKIHRLLPFLYEVGVKSPNYWHNSSSGVGAKLSPLVLGNHRVYKFIILIVGVSCNRNPFLGHNDSSEMNFSYLSSASSDWNARWLVVVAFGLLPACLWATFFVHTIVT